jgi:uncharacterized secreted repeat protein (TIGR03808 family)
MNRFSLSRRALLAGLATSLTAAAVPALALDGFVSPYDFGLDPATDADQTAALQAAIDEAGFSGKTLLLPAGEYSAGDLNFHGTIKGVPGQTHLLTAGTDPVGRVSGRSDVIIEGVNFAVGKGAPAGENRGLLELDSATRVTIRNCGFTGSTTGIAIFASSATIENCHFAELGDAAIHSFNSLGLFIHGNTIEGCGNAGIRIWRGENSGDGSIITGNRISRIDWKGGGNGQNGNGINVFKADGVIVADNHIADCAFTAVRANSTNNTQIRGNTCLNSGEVAIFSEFAFSGSIIADNIIDGAATGISITNLDTGGHLATCTGNIVRNIAPKSEVNPDTRPVGIFAEAETVIDGNVVENVPGTGILAGYGPYVRNVVISDNVVADVKAGIGVSVVQDATVGRVVVSGNLISGAERDIVGMEWETVVSNDLAADQSRYPNITIS